MRKNGKAMVSRQNPIAMEGASIREPNIPDDAPNITANTVAILACLAIKPFLFSKFSI